MSNFLNELKNRNVYKAATAYVVTGWLIMQVVDTMSNNLEWPPAIASWITKILIVGFPITLVVTWLYEVTPQGLKRTGAIQEDTPENRRSGKRLNHLIIGALAITICFMLVERVFFAGNTGINSRQQASIAVLPFENISLIQEGEGFAKGLIEQIANDLASVSGLKVIAPNSSFYFEEKDVDDREIGEQLEVNYLLKGSLQYDNQSNRIKIITRLVNANNGYSLWSDAYEDYFEEIFGIQEDVSKNVVSQLKVQLLPEEEEVLGAELTENKEAYKLYLESKNYSKNRNDRDLEKAIKLLSEAVKLDPGFAEAHAELSYLYGNRFFYGNITKEERDEGMEYHLKRALELAPEKPEVLWAKARYYDPSLKDSSQIIADLRKAISLKPNYADAHYSLSLALHRARKYHSALESMERAVELDPKNQFFSLMLADTHYGYGNVDKGFKIMNDLVVNDSAPAPMRRMALMLAKEPKGDLVEAYKLIHRSGKYGDPYSLGHLNFNLLFPLDLDLWPVSEKYARLMQMRYPDNMTTFYGLSRLYSSSGQLTQLRETIDLWVSEKGLDGQTAAINKVDLKIRSGKYREALSIFEESYLGGPGSNIDADSLDYGSRYNDLFNYIDILRFNNEDEYADALAQKLCEFYINQSNSNEFITSHDKNGWQLDCYYLTNDTTEFVKALEERFFTKKDRLDVFTDLKSGVYSRFHNNKEFQELFERIISETHRMRAEVIEYLKEEGDWDSSWDEELGLE